MNLLKKLLLAAGTAALMALAPTAGAVPFTITSASFTPGSGYGDFSPNQLDVDFTTFGFTTQNFNLTTVGQSNTFYFGLVTFWEPWVFNGETDNLGVTANLTFTNPLGSVQHVSASGTAIPGLVFDNAQDYSIVWTPTLVNFAGGSFSIALNNLSYSNIGPQIEFATVTLVSVPEPASLALLGLGLAGIAGLRRRTAKAKAA